LLNKEKIKNNFKTKKFMKKLLFISIIMFSGICQAQTTQFEKPRYLKHATLLCPIDITKSYSKEALIYGNLGVLDTIHKIELERKIDIKKDTFITEKILIDTILVKTLLIDNGSAFNVVQQIGSFSIIKFWNLSESSVNSLIATHNSKLKTDTIKSKTNAILSKTEYIVGKNYTNLKITGLLAESVNEVIDLSKSYYIVPTQTLLNNSTEFENKSGLWNIGLLLLPIKIRPFATESGQFDFSNGFSVGTTFAWTRHHNWKTNYMNSFLLYAGISSYKADESKIKEPREDYTIATFSPALGWMWEKNNVQLSLLMGIDFPAGNIQKKWVYRNQPWFGIGVGIALFKINSDTQTKSGENK
jgi:hypothetical protein